LTMAQVPQVLPVVLSVPEPIPVWLGGEPVVVGEQMPSGLPPQVARELAAVLADQQLWPGVGQPSQSAGTVAAVVVPRDADLVVDTAECDRLIRFLDAVPDRRQRRGRRYRLSYVLAVAVLAMMAGERMLAGMGEWAATAPAGLLVAVGAHIDRRGRPRRPDTATISRALAAGGDDLDRALCAWVGALRRAQHQSQGGGGVRYRSLHLDGKAVKKAGAPGQRAPMLVSVRADDGTVAAQLPIDTKTNEIPMFGPLLDRIEDLTDTVVTADQLHTQRAHATYLHHRGAHYVFTVGHNQPRLFAALDALPWRDIAIEHATVDRGLRPHRGPHHQDPAHNPADPRPIPPRRTGLPARTLPLRPRRHPPGRGSGTGNHQPVHRPGRLGGHRRLRPRPLVSGIAALAARRRPRRGRQPHHQRLPGHGSPAQPHHQHL
jgi:DDE_Tnp_1-associated